MMVGSTAIASPVSCGAIHAASTDRSVGASRNIATAIPTPSTVVATTSSVRPRWVTSRSSAMPAASPAWA